MCPIRLASLTTICSILLFSAAAQRRGDASYKWKIERQFPLNGIEYGAVRYSAHEHGLVAVDGNARVLWDVHLPGEVLGFGTWKNGLVAFYTKEYSEDKYVVIKNIHAIQVDFASHTPGQDRLVYTNPGDYFIDAKVLDDPFGHFRYLLVRTTGHKGGARDLGEKGEEKMNTTTGLSLVALSDQGATAMAIQSSAPMGVYLGATADTAGNFYVISLVGGEMIAESFGPGGAPATKLSSPLEVHDRTPMDLVMRLDSTARAAVDLSIRFENQDKKEAIRTFRFDFSSQQAMEDDGFVLDKDYYRAAKEQFFGSTRAASFNNIESLQPVDIVETSDRIIVMKRILYASITSQNNIEFTGGPIIATVYDKHLKNLRSACLYTSVDAFIDGLRGIGCHSANGMLYVLACQTAGIAEYSTGLFRLDLESGKVDLKTIDATRGFTSSNASNPPVAGWYGDGIVVMYQSGIKFLGPAKFESTPEKVAYPTF